MAWLVLRVLVGLVASRVRVGQKETVDILVGVVVEEKEAYQGLAVLAVWATVVVMGRWVRGDHVAPAVTGVSLVPVVRTEKMGSLAPAALQARKIAKLA